jgi:uncharacterized OB-fold protein
MPLFGPTMPVPAVDPDTAEFWEGCRRHELLVQQCSDCGQFRHGPAPVCFDCHSRSFEWRPSAGVGEIYTWIVVHRALHPATQDAVPYNTVVVKLDDCGGALITSNLLDVDNDDITPGMRVSVVWDEVTPEWTLPRFRPL